MNEERWHKLMDQWQAPESNDIYARLVSAYSEPHRRYHVVRHIEDCLAEFDAAPETADAPEEVEIALWFHDAVYKPTSSSNESQSADWAASFLRSVAAEEEKVSRVHRYIMATRHSAGVLNGDAALVVDIDLSILGRAHQDFEQYETSIREEYKWVPQPIYRRKRIEILQSFLDRPVIYQTTHFRERFETQARENIEWSIQRLRK